MVAIDTAVNDFNVITNAHCTSLILSITLTVSIKSSKCSRLISIGGRLVNLGAKSIPVAKNLNASHLILTQNRIHSGKFLTRLAKVLCRLYEDLHRRQHRLLTVHECLRPMLPKRSISEGLRQVQVNELTVPTLTTPKTLRVLVRAEKVALDAAAACICRTVRASNLQAQLLCVGIKTNRASHSSYFVPRSARPTRFNFYRLIVIRWRC